MCAKKRRKCVALLEPRNKNLIDIRKRPRFSARQMGTFDLLRQIQLRSNLGSNKIERTNAKFEQTLKEFKFKQPLKELRFEPSISKYTT
jgi:hypothetical protein